MIAVIIWSVFAARLVHRIFSERTDVLVSEKIDKDGVTTKKYKEKYVFRCSKFTRSEWSDDDGSGVFLYFIANVVVQIPALCVFVV